MKKAPHLHALAKIGTPGTSPRAEPGDPGRDTAAGAEEMCPARAGPGLVPSAPLPDHHGSQRATRIPSAQLQANPRTTEPKMLSQASLSPQDTVVGRGTTQAPQGGEGDGRGYSGGHKDYRCPQRRLAPSSRPDGWGICRTQSLASTPRPHEQVATQDRGAHEKASYTWWDRPFPPWVRDRSANCRATLECAQGQHGAGTGQTRMSRMWALCRPISGPCGSAPKAP